MKNKKKGIGYCCGLKIGTPETTGNGEKKRRRTGKIIEQKKIKRP